jgi:hypothetical protein
MRLVRSCIACWCVALLTGVTSMPALGAPGPSDMPAGATSPSAAGVAMVDYVSVSSHGDPTDELFSQRSARSSLRNGCCVAAGLLTAVGRASLQDMYDLNPSSRQINAAGGIRKRTWVIVAVAAVVLLVVWAAGQPRGVSIGPFQATIEHSLNAGRSTATEQTKSLDDPRDRHR